jgi:hypothetical protein
LLGKQRRVSRLGKRHKDQGWRTAHDSSTSTCCSDTSPSHSVWPYPLEPAQSERVSAPAMGKRDTRDRHGRVLKHIGDDEESDHAPSYVDLVQLGHAPIAAGDGDVLQRDVQVVFRWVVRSSIRTREREREKEKGGQEWADLRRACHGRAGLF